MCHSYLESGVGFMKLCFTIWKWFKLFLKCQHCDQSIKKEFLPVLDFILVCYQLTIGIEMGFSFIPSS